MNYSVDVVIPVYNCEHYLERCLNSVLGQTHENLHVIVVDDGSTDNSLAIATRFSKDNKKISILKQNNEGTAAARNKGLLYGKGEFVWFIDADDYVPDKYCISSMLDNIEEGVDMIIGGKLVIKNGRTYVTPMPRCEKINNEEGIRRALLKENSCHMVTTKFFSRKVLIDNHVFFPENRFYEDIVFSYLSFLVARKIILIDKPIYVYEIHEGSKSAIADEKRMIDFTKTIIEVSELLLPSIKFDRYRDEYKHFLYAAMYRLITMTVNKKQIDTPIWCLNELVQLMETFKETRAVKNE